VCAFGDRRCGLRQERRLQWTLVGTASAKLRVGGVQIISTDLGRNMRWSVVGFGLAVDKHPPITVADDADGADANAGIRLG
jgi:hypothetical protein